MAAVRRHTGGHGLLPVVHHLLLLLLLLRMLSTVHETVVLSFQVLLSGHATLQTLHGSGNSVVLAVDSGFVAGWLFATRKEIFKVGV